MSREQIEEYEQDRLGNVRRKLDRLRAVEGHAGGFDNGQGIARIQSGDTDSAVTVYSSPTHTDRAMLLEVWGFNTVGSGFNTFHLVEGDAHGSALMSNTTRRTIDIEVNSGNTRKEQIRAEPFTRDIGVVSEFEGQIGIAVISDHREEVESDTETTVTPS